MILEAYLNMDEPLIVKNKAFEVTFRNINSLSMREILKVTSLAKTTASYSAVLRFMATDENLSPLKKLTKQQAKTIFEALETHSGVTFQNLSNLLTLIDEYPLALQRDLTHFTSIKTISEFITLKPLDQWMLLDSLIQKEGESSWLVADVRGWLIPYSHESRMEQLLHLGNYITSNTFSSSKIEPPFPQPLIKKTDTVLEDLVNDEEASLTVDEMNALIDRWRTTGSISTPPPPTLSLEKVN